MTAYLLDTNALLWLVASPAKMSDPAREALADQTNDLAVSAASCWEIAIKTRLGRFDGTPVLSAWTETLKTMNVADLSIDSADTALAGQLDWDHRDPFDRMIVAQAVRRGLTIATSDQLILDGARTPVMDTRR